MFENIGKKIKLLALILTIVGVVVSVVLGIITCDYSVSRGLFIILFGVIISWVSSFFTYGFGELIDNSAESSRNVQRIEEKMLDENKIKKLIDDYMKKNETKKDDFQKDELKDENSQVCLICKTQFSKDLEVCPKCGINVKRRKDLLS